MTEATSFVITHQKLIELLIKDANLHEGKWQLEVYFSFGACNAGPSPDQIVPSAFAGIKSIGIIKANENSPESLVVDAAEVNPKLKRDVICSSEN